MSAATHPESWLWLLDSNGTTNSCQPRTAMARGSWAGMARCRTTRRPATSTTAMRLLLESATYALRLPAKAMPAGSSKRVASVSGESACTVSSTWWKVRLPGAASMTLTESDTWFATHTSRPSGRTAMPTGSIPTWIRATTRRLRRSNTSTVSAGVLVT